MTLLDSLQRLCSLSHVVIDGDHGKWTVTVLWGGAGPFIGEAETLAQAYRAALDRLIISGHSVPFVHELVSQVV